MKKHVAAAFLICALCFSAQAQHIPAYSADKLMARMSNNDTTYIINFWATWCAPCVRELPEFTALQHRFASQKVKVLLVSFDFPDAYPAKLNAYVEKKKIEPEVVWFSETNANEFIPKIDNSWTGALPGTMIINKRANYKRFLERMVTADEIAGLVDRINK
jgi:thiol-disulfide isomerase/thioredoxin